MTLGNVILIGQSIGIRNQPAQRRFQLVIWDVLENLKLDQAQIFDLKDCLPEELHSSYPIEDKGKTFSVSCVSNSKFTFVPEPAAGKGVMILLEHQKSTPKTLRVCAFFQTERPLPKSASPVHFFQKQSMHFILTNISETNYVLHCLFRGKFHKIKTRSILGRQSLPWSPDAAWLDTHPHLTFEHIPIVNGQLVDEPTEKQTVFRFVAIDIQV